MNEAKHSSQVVVSGSANKKHLVCSSVLCLVKNWLYGFTRLRFEYAPEWQPQCGGWRGNKKSSGLTLQVRSNSLSYSAIIRNTCPGQNQSLLTSIFTCVYWIKQRAASLSQCYQQYSPCSFQAGTGTSDISRGRAISCQRVMKTIAHMKLLHLLK